MIRTLDKHILFLGNYFKSSVGDKYFNFRVFSSPTHLAFLRPRTCFVVLRYFEILGQKRFIWGTQKIWAKKTCIPFSIFLNSMCVCVCVCVCLSVGVSVCVCVSVRRRVRSSWLLDSWTLGVFDLIKTLKPN